MTVVKKDCTNGFIGGLVRHTNQNVVARWFTTHKIQTALMSGCCANTSVSEFVLTLLSARNHGLLNSYRVHGQRTEYREAITGMDIVVVESLCETFDAPCHDRDVWHRVGLANMQRRGAILASQILTF